MFEIGWAVDISLSTAFYELIYNVSHTHLA